MSNDQDASSPTPDQISNNNEVTTMSFLEAIQKIIDGERITRLEWDTQNSYGELKDGLLKIFLNGQWYDWIISDGDMLNDDWIVLERKN